MRHQTVSLSLVLFLILVAFSFLLNAPAGQAHGLSGAALTPAEGVSSTVQSELFTVLGTHKVIGYLLNWPTVMSPPTVSISSPANNSNFTQGSSVQLSVVAYDTDGTISQVQIYKGTTLLGTATSLGDDLYYYSWNNVAAGSYSLTAKATDNGGAITTSAAITVISNVVPTVSIATPSNGYVFSSGSNLAISVNAADADGTVSSVQIYRDSILLGPATLSGGTYNYSWNAVPAGTYSLVARVADNYGAWANSAPINVISNVVPTVSITSPVNNLVLTAGANLPISVTAGDADGTISQVQIYKGATLLGAATSAGGGVYNYTWNNIAAGSYALTARATDNRGVIATSTAVNITVNTPNQLPTVALTSPANNATFIVGATVILSANAADSDGTVSKVEFFQGAVKLGEDTTAPYTYSWTSVPLGGYVLTARVTDNAGAAVVSGPINITVGPNQAPTVTLTTSSPPFTAGGTIQLSANAADSDGQVTKVEFFKGAVKLGEDTTAPYTYTWTSVPAGGQALTARATDNNGAITNSSVVNITVNQPPAVNLTVPSNSADFGAGSTVSLSANASDSDGTVSKVEFYSNTLKLGEDTAAPYTCLWNSFPAGAYQLTARATDNNGAITSSAVVNVTVTLPVITVVATDSSASEPGTDKGTFTITRNNTSSILQVFYSASGTATANQFNGEDDYTFTGSATFAAGVSSCTLTVNPIDNPAVESPETVILTITSSQNYSIGAPSSVTVTIYDNDSFPPSASLSAPANLSVYNVGTPITISANASDSDGTVTKVEFFDLANKLGEDTSAPYSFTWSNAALGNHFLTARATDNAGGIGTSGLIQITVSDPMEVPRLDPMNETGGGGENPLSRNFNWSLPLLNLPGRAGLNLGLSLSYNSLVWTRSGNTISFDDEQGFPGPGFRLGFPSIRGSYLNSQTSKWFYLLIGSDGGHTELRQLATNSAFYESADSAHLLLDVTQLTNPNDPSMLLRTTDGTQLTYKLKGLAYECTEIKDRNGNFITINYNASGAAVGRIANVHDTLDRVITFNYDANGWLISITQDWKRQPPNQTQVLTHTWASFAYTDLLIQTNFAANLTVVGPANNTTKRVLSRVTLDDNSTTAANNSHADFDYTPFGQVWKISNFAADNHLLNYRKYKLPMSQLWTDAPAQDECPRFTERRDWAQNWNRQNETGPEQEAITTFTVPQPEDAVIPQQGPQPATMVKVTQPNLTFDKIYFVGTAGTTTGWKVGLPYLVDSYDVNGTIPERQVATTWNQDDESKSYILNPRVSETNIYDRFGNRKKTVVTFAPHSLGNGMTCQVPEDLQEYADATTVLRTTRTTYITDAAYETRRMILAKEKMLYEGIVAPGNLRSKLEFKYDEPSSIDGNDIPVQHDSAFGSSFLAGRGNLTAVIRYNVENLSQLPPSTMKYNTAGAVVSSKDALQHEVKIDYSDSFSNSVSQTTLAYPTKVTDPAGYYSTTKYNFDFGVSTGRKAPPANYTGNPNSQPDGPEQQFLFDDLGRLERTKSLVNNAYTRYEYPANKIRIDTFTTLVENQGEAHSFQITDGFGRAIATGSDHPATPATTTTPATTARFDAHRIVYDVKGRVFKTSNPAETSAIGDDPSQWVLVEGDAGSNWVYTQQTYDWKGRPLVTTNQDGTTKEASYTGCGCAGGQVVTLTDEGTLVGDIPKRRQQKIYSDILGRTVKSEVFNWQGVSVYSTTVNTYNARDQLTLIREHQGTDDPNSVHQDTTFTYDGFGRLQTKHTPQEQQDPNNGASTDHTTWSYKPDDTVETITDARGAVQTLTYNNRHLVTNITYSAPAGINTTAPVTYDYDAAGNRISMIDGMGSKTYAYDQLSRLTSETRTLTSVGAFQLSYVYNLADALTRVTDPFGAQINYNFNAAGRVESVTGSGYGNVSTYASNIEYRAWGGQKSVTYGDNTSGTTSYNARMLPSAYDLPGLREQFQYYDDGRLKQMTDLDDRNQDIGFPDTARHFSRVQSYDHVGRVTSAHGTPSTFATFPFNQNYSYDAFGNSTGRWGAYYYQTPTSEGWGFADNRNISWTYFADGQVKHSPIAFDFNGNVKTYRDWTYDAAGRMVQVQETVVNPSSTSTYTTSYDGDGLPIRESIIATAYLIRSSVLGEVLTTIDSAGNKTKTVVNVDGLLMAVQSPVGGFNSVGWPHIDPLGLSMAGDTKTTFDPLGNGISWQHVPTAPPHDYSPSSTSYGGMGAGFGSSQSVACTDQGMPINCNTAMRMVNNGSATILSIISNQQPANFFASLGMAMVMEMTTTPTRTQNSKPGKPRTPPRLVPYQRRSDDGGNEDGPDPLYANVTTISYRLVSVADTPQKSNPTPNPCASGLLVFFNLRSEAKKDPLVPYMNSRVSDDFLKALLEINQAVPNGIAFNAAFRTRELQQREFDRYNSEMIEWNARPFYHRWGHPPLIAKPPGTGSHEGGFSFDIPLKYITPGVERIFNKHGFARDEVNDEIHFQWSNWKNLTPVEQQALIRNASAYYSNCIAGR